MTGQDLKKFKAALKSFGKANTQTADQARKVLRDEGVIDSQGRLKKPYRRSSPTTLPKAS
ncbi:hypothetical protein [Amorphus orientalis]|uniref:Uncharacterized protein n=1 Tax=Amorphus orientalis TaxID=649198 RepID=A0AAE4ATV4_9HYPH|nr:hypothetical protein [Amorphus orientalis]MDQ0317666.1 hypothetical protein [Amorphus orientalis]